MKIAIILTAFKEAGTVKKAVESLIDLAHSNYSDEISLIQVSPDEETLAAGKQSFDRIGNKKSKLIQVKDPGLGKPHALNLAIKKVSADTDIVFFTDGDIFLGKGAIGLIVKKFINNPNIAGVTGKPVSGDPKNYMMGYYGHLFAEANHYRRMIDLADAPQQRSKVFVRKHAFFPMSGYIMAVKRQILDFDLPEDVLDDAYISYMIYNKGLDLAYEPAAIACIKYPKTLSDYFKQKKRSTGGYIQLWKYGIVKEETKSRGFWHELELFWFPFKYASNIRELIWSIFLFPIRFWLWARILLEQKVLKKSFKNVWTRVESTK